MLLAKQDMGVWLVWQIRISSGLMLIDSALRKDVPPVRLTAVLEGAIAAVFEHLKNEIALEIDTPESRSDWRELVVAARKEMEAEGRRSSF